MIQLLFISLISLAQGPAPAAPAQMPATTAPATPAAATSAATNASSPNSGNGEGESFVSSLTRPFIYDVGGKRDPFSPPEVTMESLRPVGLFGPLLELQEVNLDDVILKGIVLNPIHPLALIQYPDPNKAGAFLKAKVKIKDYLGENYGVVSAIRDGQVIIVQTLDQGDKKSTTTRTLTIRK